MYKKINKLKKKLLKKKKLVQTRKNSAKGPLVLFILVWLGMPPIPLSETFILVIHIFGNVLEMNNKLLPCITSASFIYIPALSLIRETKIVLRGLV